MSLADKYSGMVNRLGKALLKYFGLESSFHDTSSGELQDIIKRVLFFRQETKAFQTANKRRGLK